MNSLAIIFTLASIGIAETVYLIKKRKLQEKPVCLIGSDCAKVLSSKYNKIFGVHNDILGLLFYVALGAISALLVIGAGPLKFFLLAEKIIIISGFLMSLYLIFLQWKIIRAWCFWCLMSAVTVLLISIIYFLGGGR